MYCEKCGWVPLPDSELPLTLPEVESYEPTDDGESPLSKITDWVNTTCPCCSGPAQRETDTMPQWAGSSWYFLRYADPDNNEELASKKALDYWMPVDWYNGGMEHTTLHLLYSRFWHKVLYDIGVVTNPEPYAKRTSHGMILGENNEKMSKSRGNVVNPDEIVEEYGADTFRMYEMFIGDFEKSVPWSSLGIKGCRRFIERTWKLQEMIREEDIFSEKIESSLHKTIKKVTEDYETLKFNTAIAAMMSLINEIYDIGGITKKDYQTFLILLNPVAPHVTEELWQLMEFDGFLNEAPWPKHDESKLVESTIEIPVQINGKVRGKIVVAANISQDEVITMAKSDLVVKDMLDGKEIKKIIYVPGKILNIVV